VGIRTRLRRFAFPPRPPRAWRPEWLPRDIELVSEAKAHPHLPEERGDLFLAIDAGTTEVEVLNWLHATVCLLKPTAVVETGAYLGIGTVALASACRANGFGRVHSIELDPESCQSVRARLDREGLSAFAEVHCSDSRTFLRETTLSFQFGFFDSLPELRAEEFAICQDRGILRGLAAFHDTSPLRTRTLDWCPPEPAHRRYQQKLHQLAQAPGNSGYFESRLSRGFFVIACPDPSVEPQEAD
jgi:predicted O-methyltransferase YrrM